MSDAIDFMPLELHWPQDGVPLFSNEGDWSELADMDPDERARLVHIAKGFLEGSHQLVDATLHGNGVAGFLVYPILFGYRHFLEISLKSMILEYGSLVGTAPDSTSHRLSTLWERFRPIAECEAAPDDLATLDVVEGYIFDFERIDPGSFAFRYAHNRDGTPIPPPLPQVNLAKLKAVMEGLNAFFLGCDGHLDSFRQYLRDMDGYS